jgi:hypothetical protein
VAGRSADPFPQQASGEVAKVALYLAIVLLALLLGVGEGSRNAGAEVLLIWETAIGLGVAHIFAFRMAKIITKGGRLDANELRIDIAVFATVAATAGWASLPYLVWTDVGDAGTGSGVLLMSMVGAAAYAGTRRGGATRIRSLTFTALGLALAAVAVAIKYLISH